MSVERCVRNEMEIWIPRDFRRSVAISILRDGMFVYWRRISILNVV